MPNDSLTNSENLMCDTDKNFIFISNNPKADWFVLKKPDPTTQKDTEPTDKKNFEYFETIVLGAINASNLNIVAGLGTSLCIKIPDNSSAPNMDKLLEIAKGDSNFETVVEKFCKNSHGTCNIETLLSKCKMHLDLAGDSVTESDKISGKIKDFVNTTEKKICEALNFIKPATDLAFHKKFLKNLSSRDLKKSRFKIFTTNYDLAFETAASELGFVVVDGFSHTATQYYNRTYFDYDIIRRDASNLGTNFIQNLFHLYKFHGSIDWKLQDGRIVREISETPVMIYPRSSKYQESYDSPFLDMLSAFQQSLREPDTTLLICGFGFNDDHISNNIWAAVENNLSLRLIIVDPTLKYKLTDDKTLPEKQSLPKKHILRKIHELAKNGDHRIHLISARFEDFVAFMPNIAVETERQRHAERINNLKNLSSRNE